jgi:hypothetical protein
MSKELESKLRAAVQTVLPADMPKSKKVTAAGILRKIAAEVDGTAPAKATKKKFVAAGVASIGKADSMDDAERARLSSFEKLTSGVESEADEAMLLNRSNKNAYRSEGSPLGYCMADPSANSRMAWDFFVIMPLLAYLTLSMPFRMCFGNGKEGCLVWFSQYQVFDLMKAQVSIVKC